MVNGPIFFFPSCNNPLADQMHKWCKKKKQLDLDFRCMREKYNMPNLHRKSDLVYNLWLYVLAIQDSGCLKVGPQWLWYMDKSMFWKMF